MSSVISHKKMGMPLVDIPAVPGALVAQWSKVLHLSARGVATDPGSIPGCITTGRDWESHRAVHNWPSVAQVRVWPG